MLTTRAQSAGRRGDLAELRHVERDVLALVKTMQAGDEAVVVAVQTLLQTLVQCRAYGRALALARETTPLLGYEPLASSELMLLLAMGDIQGARQLAEELASAPVTFGGYAARAAVQSLLGRLDAAAVDGRGFIAELREAAKSIQSWREAARRYAPSTAHTLARYGYLHGELAQRFPGSKLWDGEFLDGRTVVLQLVEGLGDQIQALRFARAIHDAGGRVLVGCDEPLHDLVLASGLADGLIERPIPERHSYGPVDFYLVVGGWLHESGLPPSTWAHATYLRLESAPPPPLLAGLSGLRVGIAWAGNPVFPLEATRGLPYASLKRLIIATPKVTWVSLQRADHPRAEEISATPATRRVIDVGTTLHTMHDTARQLQHLDLLVTTDTALAHLAGSLSIPVWTLLGSTFNWRWGLESEETVLYPSMRLIREGSQGDWNAAVDRVVRDLAALATARGARSEEKVGG